MSEFRPNGSAPPPGFPNQSTFASERPRPEVPESKRPESTSRQSNAFPSDAPTQNEIKRTFGVNFARTVEDLYLKMDRCTETLSTLNTSFCRALNDLRPKLKDIRQADFTLALDINKLDDLISQIEAEQAGFTEEIINADSGKQDDFDKVESAHSTVAVSEVIASSSTSITIGLHSSNQQQSTIDDILIANEEPASEEVQMSETVNDIEKKDSVEEGAQVGREGMNSTEESVEPDSNSVEPDSKSVALGSKNGSKKCLTLSTPSTQSTPKKDAPTATISTLSPGGNAEHVSMALDSTKPTPSPLKKTNTKKKTPKKTPKKEPVVDDFDFDTDVPPKEDVDFSVEKNQLFDYVELQNDLRGDMKRFEIKSSYHVLTTPFEQDLIKYYLSRCNDAIDAKKTIASEMISSGIREFAYAKKESGRELLKKYSALKDNLQEVVAFDLCAIREKSPRTAQKIVESEYFELIFNQNYTKPKLEAGRVSLDIGPNNHDDGNVLKMPKWSIGRMQAALHTYIEKRRVVRSGTRFHPDPNGNYTISLMDRVYFSSAIRAIFLGYRANKTLLTMHQNMWTLHSIATREKYPQTKGGFLRTRFIELILKCEEEEVLYDSMICMRGASMAKMLYDYTEAVFLVPTGDTWKSLGYDPLAYLEYLESLPSMKLA